MRPAPDTCTTPHTPAASGAASASDAQHFRAARANAATELRHAGALRRDLAAGLLPRDPAISAIRDCLRHARMCTAKAKVIARGTAIAAALALAACAQQTPPVLSSTDGNTGGGAATAPTPVEVHELVGNALDVLRPEPRPEVR